MAQIIVYVKSSDLDEIIRVLKTAEDHSIEWCYSSKDESYVQLSLSEDEFFKLSNNYHITK